MQKTFNTQPNLLLSPSYLEHPILHSLDDTEALLDWSKIEALISSIYASSTGRPSYPLLTLYSSLRPLQESYFALPDDKLSFA